MISKRPVSDFDTHSMRAGGACALWAAGFSLDDIKIIGRWRSDCVRIYLAQSDNRIRGVQARMLDSGEDCVEYAALQRELVVSSDPHLERIRRASREVRQVTRFAPGRKRPRTVL